MARALVVAIVLVGCAPAPKVALERARGELREGGARGALKRFDAIAARRDVSDGERTEALMGAAHACDALGDAAGAEARLQRAVDADVPGVVEPAEFELAERLRDRDHGRALALYYRAASGAERYRNKAWPYRAAMDRIVQISMSR